MKQGDTKDITAGIEPAGAGTELTYELSDPDIVTVDPVKGKTDTFRIRAKKSGHAVITFRMGSNPAASASCEVQVYKPTSTITTETGEMLLFEGMTKRWELKAKEGKPSSGTLTPGHITYSVSTLTGSRPVSVDADGNITGLQPGKAKIQAEFNGYTSGKAYKDLTVTVEPRIPAEICDFNRTDDGTITLTVLNRCSSLTITNVWVEMEYYGYNRVEPVIRNLLLDITDMNVKPLNHLNTAPGKKETVKIEDKDNMDAYRVVIRITRVRFSKGAIYDYPRGSETEQEWFIY